MRAHAASAHPGGQTPPKPATPPPKPKPPKPKPAPPPGKTDELVTQGSIGLASGEYCQHSSLGPKHPPPDPDGGQREALQLCASVRSHQSQPSCRGPKPQPKPKPPPDVPEGGRQRCRISTLEKRHCDMLTLGKPAPTKPKPKPQPPPCPP